MKELTNRTQISMFLTGWFSNKEIMIPLHSFSHCHTGPVREITVQWVVLQVWHAEESSGRSVSRVLLSLPHPHPSPPPSTRESDSAGRGLELINLHF